MVEEKKIEEDNPYCSVCNHCGFIECCGITEFLKKHVKGKTNCDNEASVLADIITLINLSLHQSMQQPYLKKCPKCKSDLCSGWHEVKL